MSEHFIKNIEIKNFKCFVDFKAEGFGRVNLIAGKNNIGKTALMEACSTNIYSKNFGYFVISLVQFKNRRETLNNLESYVNNKNITWRERFITQPLKSSQKFNIKTNIRETVFTPKNEDGILKYFFEIDKKEYNFNLNDIPIIQREGNIVFINAYGLNNQKIVSYYASMQKEDKEEFLNKALEIIDSDIKKFKIIEDKPYCKINNEYRELTEFGDGVKQFISIIIALYQSANGYLFIDEIGDRVHYMHLDKVWEIILTISKEKNVQVFATTHSKECIESYARVAKKLEDEDITFIELCRRKEEIKAFIYPYDWFIDEIEQEHEVRGCL